MGCDYLPIKLVVLEKQRGTFLTLQWLGPHGFTPKAMGSIPGGELRAPRWCSTTKNLKKQRNGALVEGQGGLTKKVTSEQRLGGVRRALLPRQKEPGMKPVFIFFFND